MPPADDWLDAAQASQRLGVKRATLYAYVSRGLVRSRARTGSRRRGYAAADIARLQARSEARGGHRAVAAGALRWGEPVLDSKLTRIDAAGHCYRGYAALELAQRCSFEQVAELLWGGALPDEVSWPLERGGCVTLAPVLSRMPAGLPLARLRLALALLSHRHTTRAVAGAAHAAARLPAGEGEHTAYGSNEHSTTLVLTRRLMRQLVLALATTDQRRTAAQRQTSLAASLLAALGRPLRRSAVAATDAALILLADHELNVSSFAARVAASAQADVFACISAAAATISGARHGGMSLRIEQLLAEVAAPERAASVVRGRLRAGESLPGFGHRLYAGGDPRAAPLLQWARRLAPRQRQRRIVEALVGAMELAGAAKPSVDIGLVALASALRLGAGGGQVLFAVGRIAGWVAHVLEQREAGYLMRPRARYVG
ncbi:MAG TPA: citrate synthase [Sorangium sp.]|nr:citrate synthase [Sorangium sp.]